MHLVVEPSGLRLFNKKGSWQFFVKYNNLTFLNYKLDCIITLHVA